MRWAIVIMFGSLLLQPAIGFAADWGSCASDLDDLRRAADDANDAAERAQRTYRDLQDCRQFPDIYDLLRDRCSSKVSDYRSALSSLQTELSDVESRVRDVSSSCQYEIGSAGGRPRAPTRQGICGVIDRYRGRFTELQLAEICKKSASAAECMKCLSTK
jgi:hypothetical protein